MVRSKFRKQGQTQQKSAKSMPYVMSMTIHVLLQSTMKPMVYLTGIFVAHVLKMEKSIVTVLLIVKNL